MKLYEMTTTTKTTSKRYCFVLLVLSSLFLLAQSSQEGDNISTNMEHSSLSKKTQLDDTPGVMNPECITVYSHQSCYVEGDMLKLELENCAPLADNDWIGIYREENVVDESNNKIDTNKNAMTMLVGKPDRWF
jgi:hypothetical protein